jgi:hypothetical protein
MTQPRSAGHADESDSHAAARRRAVVAVLAGLVLTLLGFVLPAASASPLLRPETRVAAIAEPNSQLVGPSATVAAVQGRERAPNYDRYATGSSVAAEGGADGQSILEQAAQGQGNFGLGSADATQANELGNEWVGDNARLSSNGKALVSQDGLRQFRFPSFKPSWGNYQANFESRLTPSGPWTSNGHLTITFGPPAP